MSPEVQLPAADRELLELLAKREGKTAKELLSEIIHEFCQGNRGVEAVRRTAEEAKKAGMTVDEYMDWRTEEALKKLKAA